MKKILDQALAKLLKDDAHLLAIDANERSITHRLAIYLEELLPDWDVDCEYNRNFDDTKRLDVISENGTILANDTQGTTVFPDIIVHKRNSSRNLLVLEMKKTTSTRSDDRDMEKLRGFLRQLHYGHAVFVKLRTGGNETGIECIEWIK